MAKVVMIKGTIYSGNADGTKMTKAVAGITILCRVQSSTTLSGFKKDNGANRVK
jgi:hypothetical protein